MNRSLILDDQIAFSFENHKKDKQTGLTDQNQYDM